MQTFPTIGFKIRTHSRMTPYFHNKQLFRLQFTQFLTDASFHHKKTDIQISNFHPNVPQKRPYFQSIQPLFHTLKFSSIEPGILKSHLISSKLSTRQLCVGHQIRAGLWKIKRKCRQKFVYIKIMEIFSLKVNYNFICHR